MSGLGTDVWQLSTWLAEGSLWGRPMVATALCSMGKYIIIGFYAANWMGPDTSFRPDPTLRLFRLLLTIGGIEKGLSKLRGMFAFALYDLDDRSLLMARDPFGIKPLDIGYAPGLTVFGSEPKALLTYYDLDRRIDPVTLLDFFTLGVPLCPATCWSAIRELMAWGHGSQSAMEGKAAAIFGVGAAQRGNR